MLLVGQQQLLAEWRLRILGAGGGLSSSSASLSGTLNASGSTFQTTFQQEAIAGFKSVQPNITVNYGGGGSGKGRTDLPGGTVNFAGSDSPIPAKEASGFTGKTILYFPVIIGPITMAYNLSGVSNLKLSPATIADIFSGKIKTWNDPAIKADNSGVSLPSTPITLAVRSDSSGTTQNFTEFLEDAAPSAWTLGSSSTIKWPSSARAGTGNPGVAQIVKSTPGAIGYVDYATAKASGLTFASVKNKAGAYVAPSAASASAAADSATLSAEPDLRGGLGWATPAYPITYQSWDLVYAKQPNANDAACSRPTSATCSATASSCWPDRATRRCPATSTRWPWRSSTRSHLKSVVSVTQATRTDSAVMSTVTTADPASPAGSAHPLSHRRPLGDRLFQILAASAGVLVLVILALIAVSTSQQASSWFGTEGLSSSASTGTPATNRSARWPLSTARSSRR